jgi:hypothetical protein
MDTLEARLAIAQSQDVLLETLQQLAKDGAEEVRRAIALNPNADEALLQTLGKEFPEEVVQNPMFGMLLLETPEKSFVRLSLARSATASPELLERYAQSTEEEILIAVGGNPNTPLDVLKALVSEPPVLDGYEYAESEDHHRIFTAIVRNPNVSGELLRQIVDQWGIAEYEIARNPKTPIDLLEKFSNWRNDQMLLALCQNPATPQSIIEKLVIEEFDTVRSAAKLHQNVPVNLAELLCFIEERPGTSPQLLEKLVTDSRHHVRSLVAKHPKTPLTALEILAQDDNHQVASQAGHNPSASEAVLINYAKSLVKQGEIISSYTREIGEREAISLINHPKTTEKILEILTLFGGGYINSNIAKSKKASVELLLKLSQQHPKIFAWEDLVKNPTTPGEALKNVFEWLSKVHKENPKQVGNMTIDFVDLIAHPNLPLDLLPNLLENHRLWSNAASNPNLPLDVMQEIIQSGYHDALRGLAKNLSTPPALLLRLMAKDILEIRRSLAGNPNLPMALLETLVDDDDVFVRHNLAENPNLPTALLAALADDKEVSVRRKISNNAATSIEILERLAKDTCESVVLSIAGHPKASKELLDLAAMKVIEPRDEIDRDTANCRHYCKLNLITHVQSSEKIIRLLVDHGDQSVHTNILRREDLDSEIIRLITDKTITAIIHKKNRIDLEKHRSDFRWPDFSTLERNLGEICNHLNTPDNILEEFANNRPQSLCDALGQGLFIYLRRCVAQNPKTPLSVLEVLRENSLGDIKDAAIQSILMRS